MADQSESGDVGARVHRAVGSDCSASLAARFRRDIDCTAASTTRRRAADFSAVAMIAGSERLGQQQHIARPRAGVRQIRAGWISPVTA